LGGQFGGGGAVVVGEVETGDDGAAEKGYFSIVKETGALPYAGGDQELDVVAGEEIGAEGKGGGGAVGGKLQHLDGVAEVEVEDLIGIEEVHFGEDTGLEEVVDCSALGAWAAGGFKARC